MVNGQPKKLAILGGGVGALASAFEITNDPNWKEKFESITVYQMGWRLGGKGASGRRPPYGRIEEHGLHIWLGCYNNSFDAIQKAYQEMGRPPGTPLATWQDAFKQHSYIVLAQEFKEKWYPWAFTFPTNDLIPGKGAPIPSLWEFIGMTIKWMKEYMMNSTFHHHLQSQAGTAEHTNALQWIAHFVRDASIDVELGALTLGEDVLNVLIATYEKLDPNPQNHNAKDHSFVIHLLDELLNWLRREFVKLADTDIEVLRFVILIDTGATMTMGLLKDGVLFHPQKLDSLDDEDLRQWLTRHGALTLTVESPLMKGLYDLVFAYHDGKPGIPNADFAAGTAIRCIFRIVLTYKGAIFWKMQAGMGDTIFTPLHQALTKRGVKFKFFHKVKNLGLSADGKSVANIVMGKQATVIKGDTEYDPYVDVVDLDCWPSDPNYDQLKEGKELQEQGVNLESFYTTWQDQDITLEVGKDFDDVIFGISLGSIPFLCNELVAASTAWQNMTTKLETVRTMAFQTWMNKDLSELGWDAESPVMDAYVDPMNTWADMSQLIPRESWPASANIRNVSYFCGPMEGGIPPSSETDTPVIALETVTAASEVWLKDNATTWWTKDVTKDGGFDRNSVVDIFYRANIDPSERYVLSVKNSTAYRLNGGQSGFDNLYLAGDWTYNGLNAGCVEAGMMSGRVVSNALTGQPLLKDIDGLGDV